MNKEFEVIALKPNEPVDLRGFDTTQVRPDQLYILPHGAIDDTPSFCFVCATVNPNHKVVVQISRNMLVKGMQEAGLVKENFTDEGLSVLRLR